MHVPNKLDLALRAYDRQLVQSKAVAPARAAPRAAIGVEGSGGEWDATDMDRLDAALARASTPVLAAGL